MKRIRDLVEDLAEELAFVRCAVGVGESNLLAVNFHQIEDRDLLRVDIIMEKHSLKVPVKIAVEPVGKLDIWQRRNFVVWVLRKNDIRHV